MAGEYSDSQRSYGNGPAASEARGSHRRQHHHRRRERHWQGTAGTRDAASNRSDGHSFRELHGHPEALFESEVFGHTKGSFTGAHRDRAGLIQQAHLGTLFLDEVGDMPLAFQAKLLRALQERTIRPVGAESDLAVDVRVIAATHRDLAAAIAAKAFREDLYYRLSVVRLTVPPLSARREDIPLLTSHFLRLFASDGVATGFSNEAMQRLLAAAWPGNVRQLANVIQQCVVLCRSAVIPESPLNMLGNSRD
jgi:two-component system response regulator GlrR